MLFISVIKLKIYKPNHCRTNGTRNFQLSIISSILNHETVENPLQTVFNRTQSLIIYSTKSTKESSTEILNVFQKKCIEIPICLNRVILKIPYFFKKKKPAWSMLRVHVNESYKPWSIFRKSKLTSSCITGVHIFKLYHNEVWTLEQNTLHYFFTFWPRTWFCTFLMCSIKYQITLK